MILKNITLVFNPKVKLILSDVDETVADLYKPAEPEMIQELSSLLTEGKIIFFITGQGRKSVMWRIVEKINPPLRQRIVIASCSGAEVWGFDKQGELRTPPLYSVYDQAMHPEQKKVWRNIVNQLVEEFKLEPHPAMPISEFQEKYGNNPLAMILEDRDSQITFEMINAFDLPKSLVQTLGYTVKPVHEKFDLRHAIADRATKLFTKHKLPLVSKFGGVFALDFTLEGVSKTTAVKQLVENDEELELIGLTIEDVQNPQHLEIWGDKFSMLGGTDRYMSEAVNPKVRSIDFRDENPDEFPPGYNIVLWNGNHHLHDGTLEYLQSR